MQVETTLSGDVRPSRLVPLIVAAPMFLQNLDTSVMTTALPSIAQALHVEVLQLNLAITAYLLSLAVFLPASGWLAERFGAKRIFLIAVASFSLGSALCGVATTLPQLIVFRITQGLGGAMMLPVGRLILLRSVPADMMLAAMVWYTIPPAFGRLAGPLFGGAIATFTSWRWIFLVNIPFGLVAILGSLYFVNEVPGEDDTARFDLGGFGLLGGGLSLLLGSLDLAGKEVLPIAGVCAIGAVGILFLFGYHLRSRSRSDPLIDLGIFRFPTFRAVILGGMPLRVAMGAAPFLLPLLLQLGLGMSPLASGALTLAIALGGLAARPLITCAIRAMGFRALLIVCTVVTSLYYASCALFGPTTPLPLIFAVLLLGGAVSSSAAVMLQTLGFSEVPKPRMSHATTLNSMAQQLWLSVGVTAGAALVSLTAWWHGNKTGEPVTHDFPLAFACVGTFTLLSLLWFAELPANEGKSMH